ncbi:MAG: 2-C-methyl-D-erythritol 4-phosphate cytidylyltransferase [Thiotrichales bacterium]|jgi:2-C-methyl-D-erythritol 4-phosphate cytidylyltransferase|nr:2-C-methyl-D-erythritol 4-phosphate cytidylyltransferase [Thiotrichales bacterium]MBT3613837.1 2-C-methyl-D-erythritol 4-phosphate cytidylyltransferase [Thiotrichales bacterium]MBT3752842.1 2-C-methyl-D-erythritol 4-phosphate cytidylyltransferase [Thiotrichales bacterium]MBT3838250.1 2-C-methyl-D-erythritol 4-phosphate cytidylyltransferase [Thiotrichales bacterium]MBT4151451.1 2-C-methyl-D-erythritol 4-phosphate cytidylyltransferase [Thiotrichales bacterium]
MIWGVIPAAGVGSRMKSNCPKQYLTLKSSKSLESTVIETSVQSIFGKVSGVVVAVSEQDSYWAKLEWRGVSDEQRTRLHSVHGGAERADSVLNALIYLLDTSKLGAENDWVLVHDAARPCLTAKDLNSLIKQLEGSAVGGILAAPLNDTIKRTAPSMSGVESGMSEIIETVERSGLWRALTPQMFRLGMLRRALEKCKAEGVVVTDDAQAIEKLGYSPIVVEGSATNIKITNPGDISVAENIVQAQRV